MLLTAVRHATVASGLAQATQRADGQTSALCVVVVGNEHMRELNRCYTGRDETTDVLTFDLRDEQLTPDRRSVVAEIYVCLEVAVEAARIYTTSVGYEVMLYIVHGMLHLVGEDDHAPGPRRKMRKAERRIMDDLSGVIQFDAVFGGSGNE